MWLNNAKVNSMIQQLPFYGSINITGIGELLGLSELTLMTGTEVTSYTKNNSRNSDNTRVLSPVNTDTDRNSVSGTTVTKLGYSEMIIGTGTKVVEATDYCLDSPLSLKIVNTDNSYYDSEVYPEEVANDGTNVTLNINAFTSASYSYLFRNTTGVAKTITEIGVINPCANGNYVDTILIYRELLEEPITLQPNEEVRISLGLAIMAKIGTVTIPVTE